MLKAMWESKHFEDIQKKVLVYRKGKRYVTAYSDLSGSVNYLYRMRKTLFY